MTAIITKQNAKDKAFINSSGGGSGGDGEFDTLHVKGISNFDSSVQFNRINSEGKSFNYTIDEIKNTQDNQQHTLQIHNEEITQNIANISTNTTNIANHEVRIKSLEESSGGGDSNFMYEDGPDAYYLDSSKIHYVKDDIFQRLYIDVSDINLPNNSSGELFKLTFPNEWNVEISTISYECDANGKIKYINPHVRYIDLYISVVTVTSNEYCEITSDISTISLLSLYSSGDITIYYSAKIKCNTAMKDNKLINVKCNIIEAENALKLYQNTYPNFYDMKSCGDISDENGNEYWYADWGYDINSDEFKSLFDGQEFRLTDNIFNIGFTLCKNNNTWTGNFRNEYIEGICNDKFDDGKISILIQDNDINHKILSKWYKDYLDNSSSNIAQSDNKKLMLKLYEDGCIDFSEFNVENPHINTSSMIWYISGCWYGEIQCDKITGYNHHIKLTLPGSTISTIFDYDFSSGTPSPNKNKATQLAYKSDGTAPVKTTSLKIYWDKAFVFKPADTDYEDGKNPFEYMYRKSTYTITPRPENCSTLKTTYNICTTGIVIGSNIESHAFTLNNMGNVVDRAVNEIYDLQMIAEQLQKECYNLQEQINEMQSKTSWIDIVLDVFKIAGALVSTVNGISAICTFASNTISGIASRGIAIVDDVESELSDIDVIDSIIHTGEVLDNMNTKELKLKLQEDNPNDNSSEELAQSNIYELKYVNNKYLLILIDDNDKEYIYNFDEEFQEFIPTKLSVNLPNIIYNKPYLTITGKTFSSVQIRYPSQKYIGVNNSLGDTYTDKQLLTAGAVKKLIDNNLLKNNNDINDRITILENYHNTHIEYIDITDSILNIFEYSFVNDDYTSNNLICICFDSTVKILPSNIKFEWINDNAEIHTMEFVVNKDSIKDYNYTFSEDIVFKFIDYIIFDNIKHEIINRDIIFDKYLTNDDDTCELNLNRLNTLNLEPPLPNVELSDKFKLYIEKLDIQQSQTITHYCPVDEDINNYIVGAPVYMSGKVFKNINNTFIPSTINDSTDCICSVKTNGSWKEYIGICTNIDNKNKCISYATHGDYLCKVIDTSKYSVGDTVYIDDGVLQILADNAIITNKINRCTVGIITAILDNNTLAVFEK